eukprot:Gregarina_sp_Poly_1__2738@NODE_1758_length_3397_cov_37_524324_g1149_i0_p1_GENE_NODE_1758_length_3397_cov_37_524324_g1149_i0NODE_1758_length_3397_cov_37_524324_g1149_i0_p1_ORF_typecomplete_len249_score42_09_NODE_1758_length_3397_cov_37_524324_g1149_i020512797
MRAMIDELKVNYPQLKEPVLTGALLTAKENQLLEEFKKNEDQPPLKYLFGWKSKSIKGRNIRELTKLDRQAEVFIETAVELEWLIKAFWPVRNPQSPAKEENMSWKAKRLMYEAKDRFDEDYRNDALCCSEHSANNQFFCAGPNNVGRTRSCPVEAAYAYFEMRAMIDELKVRWNPPALTEALLEALSGATKTALLNPNQPPLGHLFAWKGDAVIKLNRQTNVYIRTAAELEELRRPSAPRLKSKLKS